VKDALGIGFVGHGWMGRAHAHGLHTIEHLMPLEKRIRLVAIAGRDPARVVHTARELGFERGSASWEEVVSDPNVDVVANLTPNDLHAAPSIAALELGKPVLCEKPLGRDGAEAGTMLEAAERAGVTNACGFNYRFVPAVRLLHDLAASGRFGELRHFRGLYLQDWAGDPATPGDRRFQAAAQGSGAVADFSHLVDLLRHLAGEPETVSAELATFVRERPDPDGAGRRVQVDVDDAYAGVCTLPGGALATLEASRAATGRKSRHHIELNGSEGAAWWNMEDLNRLHVYFQEDERAGLGGFRDVLVTERDHPFLERWWVPGHILGWDATFVHEWRSFLEAVLEGRPVPKEQASFADGYRAALICDAILTAAREGRRVVA
jgi:predicted dehydrogenase